MLSFSDQSLYDSLKELAVIPEDKLNQSFQQSIKAKTPLSETLLKKDLISDEKLGKVIADLLSLPLVRVTKLVIPKAVLRLIPEVAARSQKAIAFQRDREGLKVAMADPTNQELKSFLEKKVGEKVQIYYATKQDINDALAFYQEGMQKTVDELLQEQVDQAGKTLTKEIPVAKIVDLLIKYAYQNKASDIHIEPGEIKSLVRFRIDGVLHDVLELPIDLHGQIIARIKVSSRLRTDEHLSAQDGKMQAKFEQEKLDIRVSIVPIVEGEKAVMRLLSSASRQFALSDLGINEADLAKVNHAFTKPYGMILATGPTGSGKTTTIYAILKLVNTRDKNIASIEDPVEYDIEGINQIQVNPKTNLTFASGLKSILRQDPDIIFVGEIRDQETAHIAINAAMTGHLVFSTLHTSNAATTLPRFMDMGIEPFFLASTVNLIVGQRLMRKLCQECRVSYTVKRSKLLQYFPAHLLKKHFADKEEIRLYRGKGCPICFDVGYVGRVGVFEVLVVTEAIRKLISSKAEAYLLEEKAVSEGMTTMVDDGLAKVTAGITTYEEVFRVTREQI